MLYNYFWMISPSRYVSTSNPFSAWSAVCTEHISPAPGLTSFCPWSVSSRWQCSWRGVCCQSFWGQPSPRYWPGNLNLILLTIVWNYDRNHFHYFMNYSNKYLYYCWCFLLSILIYVLFSFPQMFVPSSLSFIHSFYRLNCNNSQIQAIINCSIWWRFLNKFSFVLGRNCLFRKFFQGLLKS